MINLQNNDNIDVTNMTPEVYAWNTYEQNLYSEGKIQLPSPYKIKIYDSLEKRTILEKLLESLPQYKLALWAMKNADRFIHLIDISDDQLKNNIILQAKQILEERINGLISANELRKVGFLANNLAKLSVSKTSEFASRIFVQAIAVGHMRGHAIVSSDYAIKVCNITYNNDIKAVITERETQITLAKALTK